MKKICNAVSLLLLLLPVVRGQTADITTDMFIHYPQKIPWKDAQAYCRKHHIDLVSIKNEQENLNFQISQGWIGLYREDSNSPWKWSRGDEITNFTTWDTNEPAPNNNCAYKMPKALTWTTDGCGVAHTFSCYGNTLILMKENKTWEEAVHHCRALDAGNTSKPAIECNNNLYDLVTLITQDDYSNTQKIIQDATTNEVWTGLRFLAGQWCWVSGATMQYTDIQNCPTEGFCGILVKNSNAPFGISDCSQRRNFVCYRNSLLSGGN